MAHNTENDARGRFSRRSLLGAFLGGGVGAGLIRPVAGRSSPAPAVRVGKEGMYAVITGSGSALADPERGNASQAVVVDGVVLQFDFGRRAMDNLMLAGINPVNIDSVFFTHLHFDHIATYGYFIVSSWIAGCSKPFRVFGPPGTVAMSEGAVYATHQMDVEFVKKRLRDPEPMKALPEPPVEAKEIAAGGVVLETDGFKVTAAETPHLSALGKKSFAYRVDSSYGSVVISGDTGPADSVIELGRGADLLIHECATVDESMITGGSLSRRDESGEPSRAHTNPTNLGILAQKAAVKKLVPTHLGPLTSVPAAIEMSRNYYGPGSPPEIWSEIVHAIKKQYDGAVVLAEDAMVIPIGRSTAG